MGVVVPRKSPLGTNSTFHLPTRRQLQSFRFVFARSVSVPLMSEMIRTAAEMIAAFGARAKELGLAHREVDEIAGLGDGYFSKLMCGDRKPGALVIERICGALQIGFVPLVVAAQKGVCENTEQDDHQRNERTPA